MIKNIRLNKKSLNYSIKIGNNAFKKSFIEIKKEKSKKFIFIDAKVYSNTIPYLKNIQSKNISIIKINCSEKIKSFSKYSNIISQLLNKNIDRSSVIIAIGGGTLGDLIGFVASTVLRGVKLILVPTTLLSQVDSSIGGKNGINSKFGKNLIGTFYQPSLVIVDPLFLKFLPYKEIKSGYAEIVKHAIINDKKFFNWLKSNYKNIFNLKSKEINYAIEKSIKIKAKFILNDEKENLTTSASRAVLNFGHTFGHALESTNKYKSSLSHGNAISIGMIIASKISNKISSFPKNQLEELIEHFNNCGLPIKSNLIKKEKFYKSLIKDKKNQNDKINLILLNKIGKAFYAKNFKIKKIKKLVIDNL